jgi:hypothetical protein
LDEGPFSRSNFIIKADDADTIIKGLQRYLPYLETVGRVGFISDALQAGATKIKVSSKPMSNGDTYSVEAETNVDGRVSRIIFGIAGQKN